MIRAILLSISLFLQFFAFTQQLFDTRIYNIQWKAFDTLQYDGKQKLERLNFENAIYDQKSHNNPWFVDVLKVYDINLQANVVVRPLKTEPLDSNEIKLINISLLDTVFTTKSNLLSAREQPYLRFLVSALRIHPQSGAVEKLLAFEVDIFLSEQSEKTSKEQHFASNSVLATGKWYKIRTNKSGIHRITFANLQALGINMAVLNPKNIRIYANGGGVLPEKNSDFRYDDLVENAIQVVGEEDGVFHSTDYIMFYSQGPHSWSYEVSSGFFRHLTNPYDDYTYLFLTVDLGQGKRVQTISHSSPANETISDFLDYQVYEQDLINLTNTGRTWYGELFDAVLSRDFQFDFPNAITGRSGRIVAEVAGRAFGASDFLLSINGQPKRTLYIQPTQATGYDFATTTEAEVLFGPTADKTTITMKYNRSINSARGWLDYIALNVWRNLVFTGSQMRFNNTRAIEAGKIFEYQVSAANAQTTVWDVTNPTEVMQMNTELNGNILKFKADGGIRRTFVAFSNTSFSPIETIGSVANQNLHAIRNIDYLIISHPDFVGEANRLANLHRQTGLKVFVTTPATIYNEFSSGGQDITAIRDFARMLYTESSAGSKLRYLLLFGDASFDYKDRLKPNTNYVPTFETIQSHNLVSSIATDDYYGYLDPNEGGSNESILDIGIGRFPVNTSEKARQMVDKVVMYMSNSDDVMAAWRNDITFIADDGDYNHHLWDAEHLANIIATEYNAFNVDKIYLDAYKQIATPSGQKAPEVNQAIKKRIERGTLIINYSGHGGEVGWTEERILEIADINGWRNRSKLPVFITATCEFSRYDDPTRLSAGEMVFLNPLGGAIAMFTTARATYAATNLRLNKAIYNQNIFNKFNGEYPRFGDVIRRSKLFGDANDRKFVLLGDPALSLSFPKNKVVTSHINGKPVGTSNDTIKALDSVTIKGFITNETNVPLTQFNGVLSATIFDKIGIITTHGDHGSQPVNFNLRNSVIYKGKVGVVNGQFEFTFMVPKDIAYHYGGGRISYYATNYTIDAQGSYQNFIVGGNSNNIINDRNGPRIRLFVGDSSFVNGGFTSENPQLFAFLADESGINTTGAGIGHDIVATITGASERYAILNDTYVAKLNRSNEGTVSYPFSNLNRGKHTLTLKAWDILNNSNSVSIDFEVIPSSEITIDNLSNYPNPFIDNTSFKFNHNQADETLSVKILIYNINGQLVTTIHHSNYSNSFSSEPIRWNGTTDSGQPIPKGLYLYRLIVSKPNGKQTEKAAKLIRY